MDRYVVIGNPVAHSKSPAIHAMFARQTGEAVDYGLLQAPLDGFEQAMRAFVASGGRGANVTVPFKLDAAQCADLLTARAEAAGAVNTLRVDADGKLSGDNTDGAGLVADITINAGQSLINQRILIVGAGGATRGVLQPLLAQCPKQITIANRTQDTAQSLARLFMNNETPVSACALDGVDGQFDIVINATSASLQGQSLPLSGKCLADNALAYDMMYGAAPTLFLQFAAQHGARTRDGLGMLVEQAAEAFYYWRGVRPQTGEIYQTLRRELVQ